MSYNIIEQQYVGKDFGEIAMTVHEGGEMVDCVFRALYRQYQHILSSRKWAEKCIKI